MRRIQSCKELGEGHGAEGTALAVTKSRKELGIGRNWKGENSVSRVWGKEEQEMKERRRRGQMVQGLVACRKQLGLHLEGTGESPVGFIG